MSTSTEGRPPTMESLPPEARSLLRWVSTNNPFYVISAGLFLAGLWLSFGDPEQAQDTWALMGGLTAYTVLLAGTAVLLIRFAHVWDDARTVLLLVVLLFLATSVTFDRVIVFDVRFGPQRIPIRGIVCNLVGLAFAIGISEALLRMVHLRLPLLYRVPFYLMLALFFVYPLALTPFLRDANPRNPGIMWGLFGFSSAAALIALTLLPAVRRGAAYVAGNGSPWPWPLYPWALFGMLGLAVPARAILLCYSMHLIDVADLYDMTFGPYFLVPFGLALCVLLLEAGLVTGRAGLIGAALAAPIALVGLTLVGHRSELIYQQFLAMFTRQFGADPFYCTIAASAVFYLYAALRRAPYAVEAMTGTLAMLALVDPHFLEVKALVKPQAEPMIFASTMLLGLGIWRHGSWRCLVGAFGLAAGAAMAIPFDSEMFGYRWILAYHLAFAAMLLIGWLFDDDLGRLIRFIAPGTAMLACLAVMILPLRFPPDVPAWVIKFYPLTMVGVLAAYGGWLRHPPTLAIACLLLLSWTAASSWHIYRMLRSLVVGLDYLVVSLMVFGLAILVSLAKSRFFRSPRPKETRTQ